jgi:hypothetical protein
VVHITADTPDPHIRVDGDEIEVTVEDGVELHGTPFALVAYLRVTADLVAARGNLVDDAPQLGDIVVYTGKGHPGRSRERGFTVVGINRAGLRLLVAADDGTADWFAAAPGDLRVTRLACYIDVPAPPPLVSTNGEDT